MFQSMYVPEIGLLPQPWDYDPAIYEKISRETLQKSRDRERKRRRRAEPRKACKQHDPILREKDGTLTVHLIADADEALTAKPPTETVGERLTRWCAITNRVRNMLVAHLEDTHAGTGRYPSGLPQLVTKLKQLPENEWMKEPPAEALTQCANRLANTYYKMLNGDGAGERWAKEIEDPGALGIDLFNVKIESNVIKLPKGIGWVKYFVHSDKGAIAAQTAMRFLGSDHYRIKGARIYRNLDGEWLCKISFERDERAMQEPIPPWEMAKVVLLEREERERKKRLADEEQQERAQESEQDRAMREAAERTALAEAQERRRKRVEEREAEEARLAEAQRWVGDPDGDKAEAAAARHNQRGILQVDDECLRHHWEPEHEWQARNAREQQDDIASEYRPCGKRSLLEQLFSNGLISISQLRRGKRCGLHRIDDLGVIAAELELSLPHQKTFIQ